jgi:hypothetical protein
MMEGIKSFLAVLRRGKVAASLPRVFEFRYDRMHGFGWNYYVFHCGVVTIWLSDPQIGSTK